MLASVFDSSRGCKQQFSFPRLHSGALSSPWTPVTVSVFVPAPLTPSCSVDLGSIPVSELLTSQICFLIAVWFCHVNIITSLLPSLVPVGAICGSVVRAFAHGAMGCRIYPSCSYFLFQPVLHDKGSGMCYPVSGIMHIKEPLLLIGKSSLCGSSRFPLSLCELSFTICLTPCNHK